MVNIEHPAAVTKPLRGSGVGDETIHGAAVWVPVSWPNHEPEDDDAPSLDAFQFQLMVTATAEVVPAAKVNAVCVCGDYDYPDNADGSN